MKQNSIAPPASGWGWGGARPGAGRKPKGAVAGVPHHTREPMTGRQPVHVTLRLHEALPALRNGGLDVLRNSLARSSETEHGVRVVSFGVQSHRVHLIVEARHARALSRGMQGLLVRTARNLNRLWRRKGSVFADRYESRLLRTPREVREARRAVKPSVALDRARPGTRS